jgi:hypothetical protein
MLDSEWNIGRLSHEWGEELPSRADLLPKQFGVIDERLTLSEEERITLLAILLELVGTDRAIQLGDATTWRRSAEEYL